MASDGEWGALAQEDNELKDAWDSYERLPEPGENEALDAFVEQKNISIESLVRLGAKLSAPQVLAFAYESAIKFRDVVTGQKWTYTGSTYHRPKTIRSQQGGATRALVCEGESDAAWLTQRYPESDVVVLPAGALYFPTEWAVDLMQYKVVLVGLDNDETGERGAQAIIELLPNSMRFAPEGNDWCEGDTAPPIPEALERPAELQIIVPAGALLQLEVPEQASWFEHDLLPIGGLLMLHGWAKSFKSFAQLDMMAALAEGQAWAGFEVVEEATRVAIVQWEIPWKYYRDRVARLRNRAVEPELFDVNFLTYSPMRRPQLIAGNTKQEDILIRNLVDAEVQVAAFDPVRRAMGTADMNAEQDVRKMLAFFQRLNDEGITVVAVHHDNKTSAKAGGGDPAAMTGSGAWVGDPDTIVSVALPHGDNYRTSKRRNLWFTMRNAPEPGGRGMEMQEDGWLLYSPESFDGEDDDNPDRDTPAI